METLMIPFMQWFELWWLIRAAIFLSVIYLAASVVITLGYSIFYVEVPLPNGTTGQLLDIMDYISNSVMMPFIAFFSTILIGWIVTPDYVIDEMERSGDKFRCKKLYYVMIRSVAPIMMFVLFLQSTGILHQKYIVCQYFLSPLICELFCFISINL